MSTIEICTVTPVTQGGMLRECSEPGCDTLTLGGSCVAHDRRVVPELPRGVPHRSPVPAAMLDAWTPVADERFIRA